ncbi:MAG: 3-hydroxyacyl-ACP dehydratase [Chitinophagaceae bacterium]
MITPNILSLIPQRPPFVMIDSLLFKDEKLTRTGFEVREGNIFVKEGVLREPGLVENIAQTAAASAGQTSKVENKPVSVGYIGAINNLQIFSLPKIKDIIITEISIVTQVFNVTLIAGKIYHNDELLAQCEMKIFLTQTK